MRTDAIINHRQTRCPNASTLGYGKAVARRGDVVSYTYPGGFVGMGRVIGRVEHAPACGETPAIKGWLLVLEVFGCGTFASERWINPEWVNEVRDCPTAFLAWLFGPGAMEYDADTLRRLGEYGTLSQSYIDHVADSADKVRAIRNAERATR